MNEQILTPEKFQEIYTNKKLRDAVANAHECLDQYHKFMHKKALYYPIGYIVTDEQIELAKAERNTDKQRVLEANEGNIIFVGMGWPKKPIIQDGITNHRFRGYFQNKEDQPYFLEFSVMDSGPVSDQLYCNFSIDVELEKTHNGLNQPGYNCRQMQQKTWGKPTFSNLLNIVNNHFDCNFKAAVIDNFTLFPDDFVSISPK